MQHDSISDADEPADVEPTQLKVSKKRSTSFSDLHAIRNKSVTSVFHSRKGHKPVVRKKGATLEEILREALQDGAVSLPRSLQTLAVDDDDKEIMTRIKSVSAGNALAAGKSSSLSVVDRFLFTKIRALVSKKKRRFKTEAFNLDLSYITDRIIAMGFPSEDSEGLFRNPMDQVVRFFESRHSGHYRVYNLCSEPDRKYDHSKFPTGQVTEMGFDDHNPPPFLLIETFCKDAEEWLQKDPDNVVATHCKAGKGRTGTLICCLFLYLKDFDRAEDALRFFGLMRTIDNKGVTIPSQIRYVRYFEHRQGRNVEHPPVLRIDSATLGSIPKINSFGCEPVFIVRNKGAETDSRDLLPLQALSTSLKLHTMTWTEPGPIVQGDVKVSFFHRSNLTGDLEHMFSLWFHTAFVDDYTLQLHRHELDGPVKKDKKFAIFDETFFVRFTFSPILVDTFSTDALSTTEVPSTDTTSASATETTQPLEATSAGEENVLSESGEASVAEPSAAEPSAAEPSSVEPSAVEANDVTETSGGEVASASEPAQEEQPPAEEAST
eukprot:c3001_g1_i1.p1 GENE.c3001_g1_i1~~c3001_g1_i1.p1  ORF type:complete len:549 (-),score=104.33 c3001_g1_i1:58-1704(-)